jgi:hypothetical protein
MYFIKKKAVTTNPWYSQTDLDQPRAQRRKNKETLKKDYNPTHKNIRNNSKKGEGDTQHCHTKGHLRLNLQRGHTITKDEWKTMAKHPLYGKSTMAKHPSE